MTIAGFDHVAIPTENPEAMLRFYRKLGFEVPEIDAWRTSGIPFFSIHFGVHKINVHTPALWKNPDFNLRGPSARPGCGDFCFVWEGSLESLRETLTRACAEIVEGPVAREGGRASGQSLYTRDPDSNLLEFIVYD